MKNRINLVMRKIECPVSGKDSIDCVWRTRKGSVRDFPGEKLVECNDCGLVTHESDLSHNVNYAEGTMHNWTLGYGNLESDPASDRDRRLNAIQKLCKSFEFKSILDYGCGDGQMVETFGKYFESMGLEPDRGAREEARLKGLRVYDTARTIQNENVRVDVVTMFHVFEHLLDPSEEIKKIAQILKPGGLLVIETPNANDALLTFYENSNFQNFTYWSHHPMLHTHASLSAIMLRIGFSILENEGVQRYDLRNHLHWLAKGLPGGHLTWRDFLSEETIQKYETDLIKNGLSDTLWLVARMK